MSLSGLEESSHAAEPPSSGFSGARSQRRRRRPAIDSGYRHARRPDESLAFAPPVDKAPHRRDKFVLAGTRAPPCRFTPVDRFSKENGMAGAKSDKAEESISRDRLAELLNEDLAREYQAIIAYVVYSQVLKGPEFMNIADQLETHAHEELKHALILSRQIDYLGKMPTVTPKPVKTSEKAREMLRFDLDNENETIRNYRERVRQCEALGEFAMAEQIRQILVDEQDHQIDLATALGEDVPDLTGPRK
jgi:bacterioferritin